MIKVRTNASQRTNKQRTSPRTIKLTENQKLVLIKASQRDDGELTEPFDGSVIGSETADSGFGSSGNDRRMIRGFLNKGLVNGDPEDLRSLRLTTLAYTALHIDECERPQRLRDEVVSTASHTSNDSVSIVEEQEQQPTSAIRAGSKGAKVLFLLKRKSGATLEQLDAATGWQSHSMRGFLSGTARKKLGLELTPKRIPARRIEEAVLKAVVEFEAKLGGKDFEGFVEEATGLQTSEVPLTDRDDTRSNFQRLASVKRVDVGVEGAVFTMERRVRGQLRTSTVEMPIDWLQPVRRDMRSPARSSKPPRSEKLAARKQRASEKLVRAIAIAHRRYKLIKNGDVRTISELAGQRTARSGQSDWVSTLRGWHRISSRPPWTANSMLPSARPNWHATYEQT